MSNTKLQNFRSFLTERFTTVAVEVFGEFESIVEAYNEENKRLRNALHMVLNPEIKLPKIDINQHTRAATDVREQITKVEMPEPLTKKPKEEQVECDISWDSKQQEGLGEAAKCISSDCVKNDPEEEDASMPCIINSFHVKMVEVNPSSSGTLTADEYDGHFELHSDADCPQLTRSQESSSESQEPQRHDLKSKKSLTMLQNFDGGQLSEVESDSDHSWVSKNVLSSSESDSETMPRKKRRPLSPETTDPDVPFMADVPDELRCPAVPCAVACAIAPPALAPSEELSLALESSQHKAAVERGEDGTLWTVLQPTECPGRQSHNVLTEAAGPTEHAVCNIVDAATAFLCVFDSDMLKHIRDCTVDEAHRHCGDNSWDLTVAELKAFIALLYACGAQGAKNMDLDSLWSDNFGFLFYKDTMSRNRFREIMRFLRFDKKESRHVVLQDDRFALVSATWNKFIQNSIACYKPGARITIGEQMYGTTAQCRLTQCVENKPDTFGIKFWLAVDVQSKYMLNGALCLDKEMQGRGHFMGESVVLKLAEPFLGKGRNITTDSFFTSVKLATTLKAKKTGLVGNLGETKELPPSAKKQAKLFHTKVLKCADATLTIYQEKNDKNVCILSSVHTSVGITEGPEAKPESVTYYNDSKNGVNVLDQMARAYSVKGATLSWPVAVFYNILDLAGINAHILFKECTGSDLPRRNFLQQLAEELRAEFMEEKRAVTEGMVLWPSKRRRCKVQRRCYQNKTLCTCRVCHKPVCGKCVRRKEVTCFDCDT